ncbi:hypothetical protein PAHAL_1G094400 [Panicum hallii]|uniref:Uncharacterized protein n=1 Tax=Panicum hallii TaxID=206008 RepID=A0A2S3GMR8_9POAL|nr:hypothetical protein PAHAL_1G094400 [Panicum hallii]
MEETGEGGIGPLFAMSLSIRFGTKDESQIPSMTVCISILSGVAAIIAPPQLCVFADYLYDSEHVTNCNPKFDCSYFHPIRCRGYNSSSSITCLR